MRDRFFNFARSLVGRVPGAIAVTCLAATAALAEPPQEIGWRDLVPKAEAAAALKPKAFFSGSAPAGDAKAASGETPGDQAAPDALPEGKFMQTKRRQPGQGRPPKLVAELNGKAVRISGYVVPLDFEQTKVKEFLLVPFVGACIHVPPPPANQIVYVKIEDGFDVAETFTPVTVTGIIKTDVAMTGLADAGYSMEADSVAVRTP